MATRMAAVVTGLALVAAPAFAQNAPARQASSLGDVPTQTQLDKAVRFGGVAAIGPICGLRDGRWATDLRLAEMQAMGAPRFPDKAAAPARKRADQAGAALSYAEDEALEDFAAQPQAACRDLAASTDLKAADGLVAAFRAGSGVPVW